MSDQMAVRVTFHVTADERRSVACGQGHHGRMATRSEMRDALQSLGYAAVLEGDWMACDQCNPWEADDD